MTPAALTIDPQARRLQPTPDPSAGADVVEYALALLDLGRGRWTEALDRLDTIRDPALSFATLPDWVEAAVRAERGGDAQTALELFEMWAADCDPAWSLPRLALCRALVGEGDEATDHFEEALRLTGDTRPFDRARIQLLYGEHLRRIRRRTDARVQLRAAIEVFEDLRAEPWVERAQSELRATGETARKRDPSTLGDLTPQETQIAGFVAQGLSNKEVAARLFLSPRTIDHHLRNVFAKLGIKSRVQLAHLPLAELHASAAA